MKKTIAGLISLFYLTQLVAIIFAIAITVPGEQGVRHPRVEYFEDGEDLQSSLYVYAFLLGGAAFLALGMRLHLGRIIFRNLETLIVFLTSFLLLASLYPEHMLLDLVPAVALAAVKRRVSHWLLSVGVSVFTAAVVGAIMGVSLGLVPVIALMAFLSVYDIVAVFFSSHMMNVVRNVRGTGSSFLIEIPGLRSAVGISDLAVPAMFVASCFSRSSYVQSLVVATGAALGLSWAIASSNKRGLMPALPFIFAGSLAAYGVTLAL